MNTNALGRPGSDLLSQGLSHSTISAEKFNGRVRDGIGFCLLANTTRSAKRVCVDMKTPHGFFNCENPYGRSPMSLSENLFFKIPAFAGMTLCLIFPASHSMFVFYCACA